MRAKRVRGKVKKTANMLTDVARTIGSALGTVAAKTGIVQKSVSRRLLRRSRTLTRPKFMR